jgi:hypothetical protein
MKFFWPADEKSEGDVTLTAKIDGARVVAEVGDEDVECPGDGAGCGSAMPRAGWSTIHVFVSLGARDAACLVPLVCASACKPWSRIRRGSGTTTPKQHSALTRQSSPPPRR